VTAAIRTFHPRRGRLGPQNRLALDRLRPRFALGAGPVPNGKPTVLEIGSGMGEAVAAMAAADPGRDYVAVEIHTPGVASLLARAEALGLTNLRVAETDAVALVRERIAPGSLDAIHVYFPDPWPKARHHKRRLIQPEPAALLASRLRPGGVLHCATDDLGYAAAMRAVLAEVLTEGVPDRRGRPLTKFEQRARAAGRAVTELVFYQR
jgi:tRNA (guanine-N7-)-methyltransferase